MEVKTVFESEFCRSKNDVISVINQNMADYSTEDGMTAEQRAEYIDLFRRLRDKVEQVDVPTIEEDYGFYSVSMTGYELQLQRCTAGNVTLSADKTMIDGLSIEKETTLIAVPCRFVTIRDYAKILHVSEDDANEWFRSGALKYVRREGNEWLVATTCDSTGDYDTHAFVALNETSFSVEDIQDVVEITVFMKKNEYSWCRIITHDWQVFGRYLTEKEAKKLEFKLVTMDDVKVERPIQKGFAPIRE